MGSCRRGKSPSGEKEQEAWAKTTDRVHPNVDRISPLSHKTIAILALPLWHCHSGGIRVDREKLPSGDGEVWFCDPALLPADAGAAVLRRTGQPFLLRSLPNLCKQCPAGALKGTLWQLGTPPSEIVDVEKCYRKQVVIITAQISRQEDLCRKYFAVCSYTQRYLRQTDEE